MPSCWPSGSSRSASRWCSRASRAARPAPRSSAIFCSPAPPSRSGAETETILFAAARDDHVRTTIRPALLDGKWVICDRFIDSTRVYQGALGKVDAQADPRPRARHRRRRHARSHLHPRRAGQLSAWRAPRAGAAGGAADRFEAETLEFHEDLRRAYRALAQEEPQAHASSSTAAPPRDIVAERIWTAVEQRLHPERARVAESAAP